MKLHAALLLILSSAAISCGDATSRSRNEPGCGDGTAIVKVGDGFLQRLCGCDEDDDSFVQAGDPFVCTIDAGQQVIFFYQGAALPHRVVPTGTNSFALGTLYDPDDDRPVVAHPVTFDQAGTFEFMDQFHEALAGEIEVL